MVGAQAEGYGISFTSPVYDLMAHRTKLRLQAPSTPIHGLLETSPAQHRDLSRCDARHQHMYPIRDRSSLWKMTSMRSSRS